eukprot:1363897-Rhodomonas_salina.4
MMLLSEASAMSGSEWSTYVPRRDKFGIDFCRITAWAVSYRAAVDLARVHVQLQHVKRAEDLDPQSKPFSAEASAENSAQYGKWPRFLRALYREKSKAKTNLSGTSCTENGARFRALTWLP